MKQITITIDLSGRNYNCHGKVDETPNISFSVLGIKTAKDIQLITKLNKAVRDVVKPVPIKEGL